MKVKRSKKLIYRNMWHFGLLNSVLPSPELKSGRSVCVWGGRRVVSGEERELTCMSISLHERGTKGNQSWFCIPLLCLNSSISATRIPARKGPKSTSFKKILQGKHQNKKHLTVVHHIKISSLLAGSNIAGPTLITFQANVRSHNQVQNEHNSHWLK